METGSGLAPIHGEIVNERPDQLPVLVASWIWSYRESAQTRDAYERDIREWLAWCTKRELDPLRIIRREVDAYAAMIANTISQRTGRIAAPASVARKLASISSWYGYLVQEDVIERNPLAHVRRPKIEAVSQTTGLSAVEATALLAAATHDRWLGDELATVLSGFLVTLGARVSEICALDVASLGHDTGHRTVKLRMKGGKTRTRAVPPALNLAIDRYLDFRAAAVGTVRDAITGPLLVTRRGKRINRFEVYRFVRRAATAAGIASANEISPHSFRHAWAAIARERGATLEERQFALGHADPRTTQRYDRARQSLDRDPSYLVAAATAMED